MKRSTQVIGWSSISFGSLAIIVGLLSALAGNIAPGVASIVVGIYNLDSGANTLRSATRISLRLQAIKVRA